MISRERKFVPIILVDKRKYDSVDELNKKGFNTVTVEGGYFACKDGEKKKKDSSNSNE
jgi:riboflavin biosynthesis pyrimidine reductase